MKSFVFLTLLFGSTIFSNSSWEGPKIIHFIKADDDIYHGDGVNWILQRSEGSQFLLFGEQHGVAGIAEYITFIYKQLHDQGYNTLALETDGWTSRRSVELGVIPFTRQHPHSIAFDSNGDLQLMETAIHLQDPIWGMDQMQTAIHPFSRLTELAETPKQRRIARGAFFKSVLKAGRYTREDHQIDLEIIEKVFSSNSSEETGQIIKELKQTIEIFYKWMDPTSRQESVEIRETLMKQNFDDYLSARPDAKVVFKMGGAHTMHGVGPNGVLTLGDHVIKAAEENGQSGLSISMQRFNPQVSPIDPLNFEDHSMLLLDTEAYLTLNPQDSTDKNLTGFDAIIYLKDAGYADKSVNRANEKQFRNDFIQSIVPLAGSLLICLITLLVSIISILRKNEMPLKNVLTYAGIGSFLLLLFVAAQVIQILKYPQFPAMINEGSFPPVLHLTFGLISICFLYTSLKIFTIPKYKTIFKILYAVFATGFSLGSFCLHYWNIGGML